VYSDEDEALFKSFRNIKDAKLVSVKKLAAIDIISTDDTIFSSNAIKQYVGEEQ
ncbi:MAG: 50S ribosomal protein L4, partial [Candidatus Actinomarinaceae bacterium]